MLRLSSKHIITVAALTTTALMTATPAFARDQIRAVGSSTVYPFASAAAEQFGRQVQNPDCGINRNRRRV